jgi:isocitrate lyase
VKAVHPEVMLAYNLSPSFNWDAAGMSDEQMQSYIPDLARLGFCWQFITLAGFHSNALVVDTFARDFAQRGMLAYVQDIQRQERTHGVETLSHQTWSGANYYDQLLKTVTGGVSSTAAMGKGTLIAPHVMPNSDTCFLLMDTYYLSCITELVFTKNSWFGGEFWPTLNI